MFFFFFFKQKTAYEVRISDWSSDVCSSDLRWRLRSAGAALPCIDQWLRRAALLGYRASRSRREVGQLSRPLPVPAHRSDGRAGVVHGPAERAADREIGRESCRERV